GVRARRIPAPGAAARLPRREAGRRRRLRPPAQDAAELARALRRRGPRAGGGRARATGPEAGGARAGALAARVRRARGGAPVIRAAATAKLNLALVVGPRNHTGKHDVVTVLQRIDLADRVQLEPAPRLRVSGFVDD